MRRRFTHQGYLWKKQKNWGRLVKRFYRLQGTWLYYWDDENDYNQFIAKPAEVRKRPKGFSLRGYQVLVKTQVKNGETQKQYAFVLDQMDGSTAKRKNREFWVETDYELRAWVEALVAASFISQ